MIDKNSKIKWWRDARFGMFIHWGVYSLLARGEWVMYNEKIPIVEYDKLPPKFNPTEFDAKKWVKLAKDTGMKYIIITSRHHDGFSMFKTDVDDFNIVDGTPFGKDPLMELAEECQKEGIRLCFYYSHVREWRHPHAQSLEVFGKGKLGNFGNYWDYPEENKKNLQKFIDEVVKPQLKELLTGYGPISIIWFDTPSLIRPDQAQELEDIVHELQPNCLINSRICENYEADYMSLGDCEVPAIAGDYDWETPMTICHAWGYNNQKDNKYRTPSELIHQLVDIVSRGGNYLLNIGPNEKGIVPIEAEERLNEIGKWMEINNESIYKSQASPFEAQYNWGRITRRDNFIYLHIYDWREKIKIFGLKNRVKSCYLLADKDRKIEFDQSYIKNLDYDALEIILIGSAPNPNNSVLAIEIEGDIEVDNSIVQHDLQAISLYAYRAILHKGAKNSRMKISRLGVTEKWLSKDDQLSWDFTITNEGCYEAEIILKTDAFKEWDFGQEIEIISAGQKVRLKIEDTTQQRESFQELSYKVGTYNFTQPGKYKLLIKPIKINAMNLKGLSLLSVNLSKR